MPGVLLALHVALGEEVSEGQDLATVEAMKMEHTIVAPDGGRVTAVHASVGEHLRMDQPVLTLGAAGTAQEPGS